MDITWYGHSCFRLSERGRITVVTDPFSDSIGLPSPKLKGDVVTISHDAPGHNFVEAVKTQPYVLSGPGEYEIGGVFVMGIPLHAITDQYINYNVAYTFEYDKVTVLHLGDLRDMPEQSTIEALGEVNVVLVPVGGGSTLTANEAAEVVALIEPNYVIPMHYALPGMTIELDPVDKFLRAMGVSQVQEMDMLKVPTGELPEQPQVVVLRPQV